MTDTVHPAPATDVVYCVNHPQTETRLRCNRCNRPICTRCAVLTPVGYRCKDCVRGQQQAFITAVWYDYPVAIVLAMALSWAAAAVLLRLGWFIFFLAPVAGTLIAAVVQGAIRRRRGRYLVEAAAAGMVLASAPGLVLGLLGGNWFGVLYLLLYLVLAVGAFVARLRGIKIR